jgi:hypothetical protein
MYQFLTVTTLTAPSPRNSTKYTALKEELLRMRQLKTAYIVTLILSATGIIPSKLRETLKLLNLSPAV